MHRNEPIIQGDPPLKPVPGMDHFGIPLPAAAVWSALEYSGVQGVCGVWQHGPFATIIAIKQHYEGHARQAAAIALGVRTSLALGRFVVLVDEDIDPSDLRDVFWAITSRCDPATQTQVMQRFPDQRHQSASRARGSRCGSLRRFPDRHRRLPAVSLVERISGDQRDEPGEEKTNNRNGIGCSINSVASAGDERNEIDTNQLDANLAGWPSSCCFY